MRGRKIFRTQPPPPLRPIYKPTYGSRTNDVSSDERTSSPTFPDVAGNVASDVASDVAMLISISRLGSYLSFFNNNKRISSSISVPRIIKPSNNYRRYTIPPAKQKPTIEPTTIGKIATTFQQANEQIATAKMPTPTSENTHILSVPNKFKPVLST